MSVKNRDRHQRWRCVTVGFRMSPQEKGQLDTLVELSGMTKQDYITSRLLNRELVVVGNPRVYKALKDTMNRLLAELQAVSAAVPLTDEQLDTISFVARLFKGMETPDTKTVPSHND